MLKYKKVIFMIGLLSLLGAFVVDAESRKARAAENNAYQQGIDLSTKVASLNVGRTRSSRADMNRDSSQKTDYTPVASNFLLGVSVIAGSLVLVSIMSSLAVNHKRNAVRSDVMDKILKDEIWDK